MGNYKFVFKRLVCIFIGKELELRKRIVQHIFLFYRISKTIGKPRLKKIEPFSLFSFEWKTPIIIATYFSPIYRSPGSYVLPCPMQFNELNSTEIRRLNRLPHLCRTFGWSCRIIRQKCGTDSNVDFLPRRI